MLQNIFSLDELIARQESWFLESDAFMVDIKMTYLEDHYRKHFKQSFLEFAAMMMTKDRQWWFDSHQRVC